MSNPSYHTHPHNSTMQNDILKFSIPLISKTENAQPTATTSLVLIAWFIGAIFLFAFFSGTHLRCTRTYRMALPIDNPTILEWQTLHPLRRNVKIKQSDKINAPLTYGVLHPVVLLPKTMDYTGERQLQYVLAHEYTHIKHFDIVCKWLLVICLCVHWFNPFVWIMYIVTCRQHLPLCQPIKTPLQYQS